MWCSSDVSVGDLRVMLLSLLGFVQSFGCTSELIFISHNTIRREADMQQLKLKEEAEKKKEAEEQLQREEEEKKKREAAQKKMMRRIALVRIFTVTAQLMIEYSTM